MSVPAFRLLLAASIGLVVLALVVDFAASEFLPLLLLLYLEGWEVVEVSEGTTDVLYVQLQWNDAFTELAALIALVLLIPFLAAVVVTYVGLFRLRPWGAWLMLVLTGLGLLAYPLAGAVVVTGWGALLFDLGALLHGAILAIVFVGPLRSRFFGEWISS